MTKRLKVIERHLNPAARKFLDCGCGCGAYVQIMIERYGVDAFGIEFDEEKVKTAQSNPVLNTRIARGDLQKIDQPSDYWDYAMLNEVLEHVPDDRQAVREVWRILKPGGRLFVFSPNRWFPFETHGVHYRRSQRRVPHWVPFIPYIPLSVGRLFLRYWARNYWQGELARLLKDQGFFLIERNYIGLTFEDISGHQPRWISATKPGLRFISDQMERVPFLKRFGVSQSLVCGKK